MELQMKVVLFCGGFGTRLREYSDTIPKPLVTIGYRPIIWHLMKYYAHYGHNEFILCLGYRGDMIKDYFLNYQESISNDFVMTKGGKSIEMLNTDIDNWKITFVDTGLNSNIGQRLKAVEKFVGNDEVFLANYSDGLSDLPLDEHIKHFTGHHSAIASFVRIKPVQSFHNVTADNDGVVDDIRPISESDHWINGGFFVFRKEIFSYIHEGEELVEKPFKRLIAENKLLSYKFEGFWRAMDTFKDKMDFDERYLSNQCPWQVWGRELTKAAGHSC